MRTPGPWFITGKHADFIESHYTSHPVICQLTGTVNKEREANAHFIATAANCHDGLVAALEMVLKRCVSCGGSGIAYTMNDETEIGQPPGSSGIDCPKCYDIRKALDKVKSYMPPMSSPCK